MVGRFIFSRVTVARPIVLKLRTRVPLGVNVINLHRLPAVYFTGLAVFAAASSALIDHLLESIPRQFTHASTENPFA